MNSNIEQGIETAYPNFQEYVKHVRGFMSCPSIADIKLWHEYLEFQKPIIEELNARAARKTTTNQN